ncbi:MAG TPA: hypothetical protein VF228_14300 [Iamia sp.]
MDADRPEEPDLTPIGWQSMSSQYGGGMQHWAASPDDPQVVAEWCRASLEAGIEEDEEREQLGPRSWVVRRHDGRTVSTRSVSVHDLADDPPPVPPPEPPPPGTRAIVIWSRASHSPPPVDPPTSPPPVEPRSSVPPMDAAALRAAVSRRRGRRWLGRGGRRRRA